jgi:four helix bundle protein
MDEEKYLKLGNIGAYISSFHLSNKVWDIVLAWSDLAKQTIGKQFIRSIDSISANTAEGFGRYSKKEKVYFYRVAKGSIQESLDWNEKAWHRKLTSEDDYKLILGELLELPKKVNALIKFTNEKLKM